ncbi:MAG: glutamate--tRNA ligase [Candidatus Competibacteraceae bacterium]|nr:glutamate--tRNA ligase [Candidatus Competibacteraceae bacterium]
MTNSTVVKTRFAPSPTGHIHLGNARTALFNALLAFKHSGIFLLRIEDTDQERSQDVYVRDLLEDLRWLGLDWQEGPEREGESGPYFQSARDVVYERYYQELESKALVYPCFCSPTELALSRKAQLTAGRPPRYSGTCARLNEAEREVRRERGIQPTLRFRVPTGQIVEFEDLVRGPQRFQTDDIGDFIIRRADGSAQFFFTNAVDDALMAVTHVLRGEDHLTNTPRQLLLLQALDLPIPHYGHISLLVGNDGSPLSKRHGSRSLRQLRAAGYLPEALNNYMARLGHTYTQDGWMSAKELAAEFNPERLSRAPARYDEAQLLHWQTEAVHRAEAAELWEWMGQSVHERVPETARQDFITTVRPNIHFPAEAQEWAQRLFGNDLHVSEDAQAVIVAAPNGFFENALAAYEKHGSAYKDLVDEIKKMSGVKGKALFMPLRAALTGLTHGPELARMLALIPADSVRQRFGNFI